MLIPASCVALEPGGYLGQLAWARISDVLSEANVDIYFESETRCSKFWNGEFVTFAQLYDQLKQEKAKDLAKVTLSKTLRAQYSDPELTNYAAKDIVPRLQNIGYNRVIVFAANGGGFIVLSDTAEKEEGENPNLAGSVQRGLAKVAGQEVEYLKNRVHKSDLIFDRSGPVVRIYQKGERNSGVQWTYQSHKPEVTDKAWMDGYDYKIEKSLFGNKTEAERIKAVLDEMPRREFFSTNVKF